MFLYVVWSTQPDDKHLYRVVHIPIEIDTLQQLHAATQHSDFLSWIVSQLSFTIHPQQTLLPRQIPATTVAKHIPSQDRAEVVVEHLIKAKERLRLMEKRMSLIKEGRVGEVMLGEHLLDLEDDEEDVELPDIDVASNAGIEQLKGEVTATLNQLERLSTEAHTLAIEVMKTYE
ncbi:hypothetical protein E3P99_01669 [Wallemia hederae]|uniref:Uncharacterized protein n=1 Tax=Wallemia hederae TaxID=1540922 RepID=A0A4T0FQH0_9BASI|nr:hypothetical protein E3P99_01669 [Wallemia hederae]